MQVTFHSYDDILNFVRGRRNGLMARRYAHENAIRPNTSSRVGRLSAREFDRLQGEIAALDLLLSDLMRIEFKPEVTI